MKPTRQAPAFDTVGATLLAAWVGALIFALVETSNGWAWTDPRTVGLLATALILLPIFLWVESKALDPLVPLQYFRNRLIAAASAVNFLRGAVLTVVVTYIPILVVFGLGATTDSSRNALYGFMVPMIIGAALGGQLVTRVGYRTPVVVGLLLCSLGTFFLTLVPVVPPVFRFELGVVPVGLVGALIPLGMGVGFTFAPTQLAIQYSVPREDVGTGNSLVWFLSNLGGAIVVSLMGTFQGNRFTSLRPTLPADPSGIPAYIAATQNALAGSVRDVWWIMVPISIAGALCALLMYGRLPTSVGAPGESPEPPPAVAF